MVCGLNIDDQEFLGPGLNLIEGRVENVNLQLTTVSSLPVFYLVSVVHERAVLSVQRGRKPFSKKS